MMNKNMVVEWYFKYVYIIGIILFGVLVLSEYIAIFASFDTANSKN